MTLRITQKLRARARGLVTDENGNVMIEAMIILPIMFWAYLTMFTIFDAYRQVTVTQKANYTVSDMISRQAEIDAPFLDGMMQVFNEMVRASRETAMRVTSVTYDADTDEYLVLWSQTRGSREKLTTDEIKNWHEKLPVLADESSVVVVETWSGFQPVFNIGLEEQGLSQFTFTRPRYTKCVIWRADSNSDCLSAS
jgi:hypothetical protein